MRKYNKKTTGFVKIATVILLIFSFVTSAFPMLSYADDSFDKLWAEKLAYEEPLDEDGLRYTTSFEQSYDTIFYGDFAGEGGDVWGFGFEFLPFTEQGKKLTYKYYTDYSDQWEGAGFSKFWNRLDGTPEYLCIELENYYDECHDLEGYNCMYRFVIQKLGITADELREAYRRMSEEPEYARQTLKELTDSEFEAYAKYLKNESVPPNFVIEAACMKDEEKAASLLVKPGSAYVKELGYCIDAWDLFFGYKYTVEDFQNFDLTTVSLKVFFADIKAYFEYDSPYYDGIFFDWEGYDDDLGRTPRQRFEALYAEYERQLENPKTGEELVFVPLAIVSFILGIMIVCKKRRSYI
ncbi:MAG: hypothetical protein E7675_01410 [Ruminococcaceae bacterium]|nr:hypothetical protein [Oscillospiraceae bacterium]